MMKRLTHALLGLAASVGVVAPVIASDVYYYPPQPAEKRVSMGGFGARPIAAPSAYPMQNYNGAAPVGYYPYGQMPVTQAQAVYAQPPGAYPQQPMPIPVANMGPMADPVPMSSMAGPVGHAVASSPGNPVLSASDTSCDTTSCGKCGGCYAGVGVYYVKPLWETNPAYLLHSDDGELDKHRQNDFHYDYGFGPRVWLGYTMDSGIGIRARWWGVEQDALSTAFDDMAPPGHSVTIQSAAPNGLGFLSTGTPGQPTQLTFESHLNLDAYDLEGTKNLDVGGANLVVSVGARFADLSQSYNALEVVKATDAKVFRIRSGNGFTGVGPTGAFDVRYDIGSRGFALVGNARGAILFGEGAQEAFKAQDYQDGVPNRLFDNHSYRQDVLPVIEAEIGAEWTTCLRGCNVFVQATIVSQTWFGAGNGAMNEQLPSRSDAINIDTADNSSNLGFFGVSVTGGLRY